MPGLFGIWSLNKAIPDISNFFKKQAQLLKYKENHLSYKYTEFQIPDKICIGKVFPDSYLQEESCVYSKSPLYLMRYGTIFNWDELQKDAGIEKNIDIDPALSLYIKIGWDWLKYADGRFAFALYNSENHSLELVSDRYGYSPLYYCKKDNFLIFAPEIKAVVNNPYISETFDKTAVKEYFTFGYFIENKTWFNEIQCLDSGTILHIDKEGMKEKRYWFWNQIIPKDNPNYKDALEELGVLWKYSVESRLQDKPKFLSSISGGLDSRAILAALPCHTRPAELFCYGEPHCPDRVIAQQASEVKRDILHQIDMDPTDWINKRKDCIWKTDGQLNLIHFHAAAFKEFFMQGQNVILDGFLGDLFLGGSYLKINKEKPIDTVFRKMHTGNPLGLDKDILREYLEGLLDKYKTKDEFFLIHQRGRRFNILGVLWLDYFLEARLPFTCSRLLQFIYSLPSKWRWKSRLYKDFLLKFYPEYFQAIPWKKTGLPVSISPAVSKGINLFRFLYKNILNKGYKGDIPFCNYQKWFREENSQIIIKKILLQKKALWTEFVDPKTGKEIISNFLDSPRFNYLRDPFSLLLTMEMYLQGYSSHC